MLYNNLLPVNHYIGSVPTNVIAKTLNNIRTSHGYFIRSLGHCRNKKEHIYNKGRYTDKSVFMYICMVL